VRAPAKTSLTTTSAPGARERGQPLAGVGGAHPDAGVARQRQVCPDQLGERLSSSTTRCREPGRVAATYRGSGQCAAAEVHDVDRPALLGGEVEHVAHPAHVLELQVGGVLEVDVRLRRAVHHQHPGAVAVGVPEQLGGAAVDGRGAGRDDGLGLPAPAHRVTGTGARGQCVPAPRVERPTRGAIPRAQGALRRAPRDASRRVARHRSAGRPTAAEQGGGGA
jgi:hypothetical protein